jgi:protein subunit release factor A
MQQIKKTKTANYNKKTRRDHRRNFQFYQLPMFLYDTKAQQVLRALFAKGINARCSK